MADLYTIPPTVMYMRYFGKLDDGLINGYGEYLSNAEAVRFIRYIIHVLYIHTR